MPFHIDFVGNGTFDQFGPILGILAVLGIAGAWLFRRRPTERTTVAPDVATAMWGELDEAAPQSDGEVPQTGDQTVPPRSTQPTA